MLQDRQASYYQRREASARTLAARATDPGVARIHTDLADRYAALAQEPAGSAAPVTSQE